MVASNDKSEESTAKSLSNDELTWIVRRDAISWIPAEEEGVRNKMVRKIKENPFIPIGMLATTGALSYGLWCMRTGQAKMSQNMMRLRVAAQGFTVIALLVGLGLSASKSRQKASTGINN